MVPDPRSPVRTSEPWSREAGSRTPSHAGLADSSGAAPPGSGPAVPVVVLNPYYTGLGIARNLHGTGVRVHALTSDAATPGARSRYFASVRTVPDGRDAPEALCAELLRIADSFGAVPILFPTRDFDILFLHEHRARLAPCYLLPYRDFDAVLRTMDKLEVAGAAQALGIPTPATLAVESAADVAAAADRLRFPVIVKPRFAYQWRHRGLWERIGGQKAFIAATRGELDALYARLVELAPHALVQEFVPGVDHDIVVCCCVVGGDGALLGHFTGRKLRQSPPLVGTGCVVEASPVHDVLEPTLKLLRSLGYTGIAEVEYKLDRTTGVYHLIEINPRHWDQHELGRLVGINVTWLAYADLAAIPVAPCRPVYEHGARYRWIAESELVMSVARDMRDALRVARTPASAAHSSRLTRACSVLATALSLVRGRRVFGMWRLADPRPGLGTVTRLGTTVWAAVRRRGASSSRAGP